MSAMSSPTSGSASTIVMDIGNARIKWALANGSDLVDSGHVSHAGALDGAIDSLATDLPEHVQRLVVANVAGSAVAMRLAQLARERYGIKPAFVRTRSELLGVRCGYLEPRRLGVDRWIAAVAAWHFAAAQGPKVPVCAINAGTAVTLDAVDASGQHLGGLILPGPRLAAAALDRNTQGVGATQVAAGCESGLALLGRTTDAAVGHGALLGPAAAFDRVIDMLGTELGAQPRVYLAGGDAALLGAWLKTEVQLRVDLVLEGLALVAAAATAGSHAIASVFDGMES